MSDRTDYIQRLCRARDIFETRFLSSALSMVDVDYVSEDHVQRLANVALIQGRLDTIIKREMARARQEARNEQP